MKSGPHSEEESVDHHESHSFEAVDPRAGHAAAAADSHAGHSGATGDRHAGHSVADFKRRFIVCLLLTVPVVLLSEGLPFLSHRRLVDVPGADLILLALSTAIYLYGGAPFLKGLVRELKQRAPGMMTLVAVAITVAYAYSAAVVLGLSGMPLFWELATLVDIMLLGHWIEMRAVGEASRALESLAELMPSVAHRRLPGGTTEDVPLTSLVVGDIVVVKPGEKAPADGTVVDGASSFDESLLTGESIPVLRQIGDEVIGGSINGQGSVSVEVRRTGSESFVAQVVELVREAQQSKSATQDLADKAARVLTVVALGVGALTFAVWLVLGRELPFAMERTVATMVIACPHALGLAIPLVIAVSTAAGAKSGLLVRNRMAFENARKLDVVVLDKTGTLTMGKFGVTDVEVFGTEDRDGVLRDAGAIEQLSEHPIARAIAEYAPPSSPATDFEALVGRGARGTVDGHEVAVVSPRYLSEHDIPLPTAAASLAAEGKTVVYVVKGGLLSGAIALADSIRPEARSMIRRLEEMGIEPVMLTGDSRLAAQGVASALGINRYFAEVLPSQKAEKVQELRAEGSVVAMVGDGVNDAPALASADVGIAIGAGADVAVSTADVVLVRSNPEDIVTIIRLSRATYSKMVQNLAWATGYNVIAIPLAAGVLAGAGILLSPAVGGVLMSASTVIVAINARLLRIRD